MWCSTGTASQAKDDGMIMPREPAWGGRERDGDEPGGSEAEDLVSADRNEDQRHLPRRRGASEVGGDGAWGPCERVSCDARPRTRVDVKFGSS